MEQFLFNSENVGKDASGNPIILIDGDENFHLSRVLRVKVGEKILATDGAGRTLMCVVESLGREKSVCSILEEFEELNSPRRVFCIAMALLKPMSKIETALEKCTELGAGKFLLFNSERSERTKPRLDRLRTIIRSAVKQSLRSRIPEVEYLENLHEVTQACAAFSAKLVLHEKAESMAADRVSTLKNGEAVTALIGPEGGFSEDEIAYLIQNGYGSFSLGKARLRSETAAISTATLLSSI